jgi:IclR family transcriptional regulator, acetate operon repressor
MNMIQVIQRALTILEYIAQSQSTTTLGELAAYAGINATTCANIVKELVQNGYLEQEGHGKGYRLGAMACAWGQLAGPYQALRHASEPVVHRLAEKTGETSLVSVLSGSRKLVVCFAEGIETIRFTLERGVFDDIHWTGGGILLLAHATEKQRSWISQCLWQRWGSNPEALEFLQRLPDAMSKAIHSDYVVCETTKVAQFAVALRASGRVVATLGITVPQFRASPEKRKQVVEALLDGALEISSYLAGDVAVD